MPVPFLVPAIGALVGTAAAPAIGMSAALAAGLGGGIATLAAGGSPKEALLAGATAGVGSALMPALTSGVAGAAAQGGKAAAAQGAAQAAPKMAADTVRQAAISGAGTAPTQVANIAGEAAKGIQLNPEKAVEMGLLMASQPGDQRQTAAPSGAPMMAPSMNLSGQSVNSGQAMQRFDQLQPSAQPGVPAAQLQSPTIPSVTSQPGMDPRLIPLQMGSPIRLANGGIASMAGAEMARRGMRALPNLGDREQAYMMARQEFARGGYIEGPGTGTSDDIPAQIYQDGQPVGEALLSDGEVVLSHKDLAQLDPKGDSERAGQKLGNAGNGNRGKMAAQMFLEAEKFRERAA